MRSRATNPFTTVRTEGGLLPVDLLQRVAEGDARLGGLSPEDYHLSGEKLGEAVSRSWQRLLGAWRAFRSAAPKLSQPDPGTSLTREKWLLPLFQELGYGRLVGRGTVEVEGVSYPVSHAWEHAPIHLLGFRVELDRRTAGVAGAARTSPHGLVQELLNRSDAHLWGFLSNGHRLRILRDSVSLARPAYLEWDLEAMMEGEVYPDFVLLWLFCHQSRVEAPRAEECWLERWARAAQEQGTRVLEALRLGVERAINALGAGFLAHAANRELRDRLRSGELDRQEYYRQLLRVVYRMLFLFVAEDRELLLDPAAPAEARARYERWYSTARLRRLAERRTGTRHADLIYGLRLVTRKLGEKGGCAELGLPALGSFLFSVGAAAAVDGLEIANHHLLDAVRALAFTSDGHRLRPVDFRNLGSRELGSVYESLLELHPDLNVDAGTFVLRTVSGSERKTTGSYYTPESLIQALLDSALDPVLDEAARAPDPAAAILALRVCDPACGSGHFLISAAHRIAKRLAGARSPDEEPSPEVLRHALRDVIGHCLYGVDLNAMAVELCKVSLWMEALEPGRPLSFLDHRILVGNSLLGTTPALLRAGIPDEAFTPIEGDDRKLCAEIRKQNRRERVSEQVGFFGELYDERSETGLLSAAMRDLDEMPDATFEDVQRKQAAYAELERSSNFSRFRRLADTWCAAFVWKKTDEFPYAITEEVFRQIERNPDHLPGWMRDEINRLREQYVFFHWHLAFPDVFCVPDHPVVEGNDPTGWEGGFDVVLGNPPWDMQELKDNEFFALSWPDILSVKSAKDKERVLTEIQRDNPELWARYEEYVRKIHGEKNLLQESGRFPLSAVGRINLYRALLETGCSVLNTRGALGMVIPSGFVSDSFTQRHFNWLHAQGRLKSFYDFENRGGLFSEVHSSFKFALITISGTGVDHRATDFVFFAKAVEDLAIADRHIWMSEHIVRRINPLTATAPLFKSQRELDLTQQLHSAAPILIPDRTPSWEIQPMLMFMMNADLKAHRSADELEAQGYELIGNRFVNAAEVWLPFYEGKMVGMYDHRAASIRFDSTNRVRRNQPVPLNTREHYDPWCLAQPMFWLPGDMVAERCGTIPGWCLAVKDVTSSTNERTAIAAVLPRAALTHSVPYLRNNRTATENTCLLATLNSFVLDFVARQKVAGLHLYGHYLAQLPCLPPSSFVPSAAWTAGASLSSWVASRVIELTYTAWDLEPFAEDCGYEGPPFRWDEERRFLLRCELDAAFFHLYGIEREDVDYIMDTFPIVRRKDEAAHGEYRTKHVILEVYDEMAEAARTGASYRTRLDPPPADARVAHPEATRPSYSVAS